VKKIPSTLGLALLALCAPAMAQHTYPTKPITLVVGFPPGGGADSVARLVSDKMGRILGQPIIIDNRAGAGTTLGSDAVAKAPADGYTLLLGSANLYGSDQLLYKSVKYDGARSFTPISRWSSAPLLLAVNKDFNAQSVADIIQQARRDPGKLTYASSGSGVTTHLAGLSFSQATGIEMLHVPFKGGAPAIQAVAAGDVQMTFGTPPSILPMVQAGKMRILAVTTAQRSALFPNLPGMAESGVKGLDYTFWFGLFGPAGLPADISKKLFDASVEALKDPEVKARLEKSGNEAVPSASIEAFREWALAEGRVSKALTQQSGASLQ
jgi:tripartite-type tricarboxylate transporter receptor subunit TctC